jgi:hypothetical protein
MDSEKKQARVVLLTSIGEEVQRNLRAKHVEFGADPREIVFRPDKVPALVDDYDRILEEYRQEHIPNLGLVGQDKIAAFTGILIMRHWVFESETGEVNTRFADVANETYAVRIAALFVKKARFGFTTDQYRHLLFCFGHCHDHEDCMKTWTVAAMTLHLSGGTIAEETFAD